MASSITAESLGGEMISGKTLIFVVGAIAIAWAMAVMPEDQDTDARVTAKSEALSRQPASSNYQEESKIKQLSAPQVNTANAQSDESSRANAEMNGSSIDQGSMDQGAAVDESGDSMSNSSSDYSIESDYPTDDSNDYSNEERQLYRPGSSPGEYDTGEYGAEDFDEDPMALDPAEGDFGFGQEGEQSPETEVLSPDTAEPAPTPSPQEIAPQQTWTSGGNLFPPVGTPTPAPEASPSEQSGPGF